MSRADRVLDLLDFLRASDATSVAKIAAALTVSRRTVLRDLATLRGRGWPIRSEPGPGGGVVLDRDRGAAAVHLTVEELASLWLSARLSASNGNLPWSAAARSALAKAFSSLPAERGRLLRSLLRRVVVGPPATSRVLEDLRSPPPGLLTAFESAFAKETCLAFDYTDRNGEHSRRIVEPHGLLVEAPAWYLLARDTESGDARMFRMDRIRQPRLLLERRFKPDFEGLRLQADKQRRGGRPEAQTAP